RKSVQAHRDTRSTAMQTEDPTVFVAVDVALMLHRAHEVEMGVVLCLDAGGRSARRPHRLEQVGLVDGRRAGCSLRIGVETPIKLIARHIEGAVEKDASNTDLA